MFTTIMIIAVAMHFDAYIRKNSALHIISGCVALFALGHALGNGLKHADPWVCVLTIGAALYFLIFTFHDIREWRRERENEKVAGSEVDD